MRRKRKGRGQSRTLPRNGDPLGLSAHIRAFLEWTRVQNLSENTCQTRFYHLADFFDWCQERSLGRPTDISKPILEQYQRHLFRQRKSNNEPLSARSQAARLSSLKAFFRYLSKGNHILYNPASEIELPKLGKRLPHAVLSLEEVDRILAQPQVHEAAGLRDRAILETLYSTGMRRMELVNLSIYDVDRSRRTVLIRRGKGDKDRVVPIGKRALSWLDRYLEEARSQLLVDASETVLFINDKGQPFRGPQLSHRVRGYVITTGKSGSCHIWRHTMATQMLENGADIRFIQELLGHAQLSTTEIYTRISIAKLREIHEATHPARLSETEDLMTELEHEGEEEEHDLSE